MKDFFILSIDNDLNQVKQNRVKFALVIVLLFIVGALLNTPFSREVKRLNIEAGNTEINLNPNIMEEVTTTVMTSAGFGILFAFLGLWLGHKTKLGTPLLSSYFSKNSLKDSGILKQIFYSMLLASLVAIILLILLEFQKSYYPVDSIMQRPSKPFYFFVAFSAGITEEIIFRLSLMTLIVAFFQFMKSAEVPSKSMIWTAMFISSIFFGLLHLPLSKNFVEVSSFTVAVTMIGNLITGLTFGWIYWKRGLIIAIISHITFDLIFHVVGGPYA